MICCMKTEHLAIRVCMTAFKLTYIISYLFNILVQLLFTNLHAPQSFGISLWIIPYRRLEDRHWHTNSRTSQSNLMKLHFVLKYVLKIIVMVFCFYPLQETGQGGHVDNLRTKIWSYTPIYSAELNFVPYLWLKSLSEVSDNLFFLIAPSKHCVEI